MQSIHKIPFSARDQNYEIRVFNDNGDYHVAGFLGDHKVTARYSVEMTTDYDFHNYTGSWAHDHLVAAVKKDIEEGRVAP